MKDFFSQSNVDSFICQCLSTEMRWWLIVLTFLPNLIKLSKKHNIHISFSFIGTHCSRLEILKKSRQKNSWNQINQIIFSWNCIFGSFQLFPSSKMDFWPFLKLQKKKWNLAKNKFREIDFTSFFGRNFFLIFWPTVK